MNKNCIIISGGTIEDSFALQVLETVKPQAIIGVDGGLSFLHRNRITPTHIVGDFDSADEEVVAHFKAQSGIAIREFNPIKDSTDTEIAVRLAVELGATNLWLIGATGTRLDHVLANIQILQIAHEQGIKAYIVDTCNRISVHEKEIVLRKEDAFGKYFSLFSFAGVIDDVTIEGAKYPVSHACLSPYESRYVSNEILDAEVRITFPEGEIILMETRDKI